jgi:branched-chain amino acid transport system ATP-binding protein
MATALALKNVSKSFGAIHIATGLDLEVRDNEAVGILGPNGAGKTTILGLIAGTLALDAGACRRTSAVASASRAPTRCRSHSAT